MRLLCRHCDDISSIKTKGTFEKSLLVCDLCGWWKAEGSQDIDDFVHHMQFRSFHGAAASLRELDLTDIAAPLTEVRSYLLAKYDVRGAIHPRLFEQTVASVFADLGYQSQATSYSGDDGIDVILARGAERIGVQVKRYKNSIEVEQIRSLAGALLLNGLTCGIFVTTSAFQRGGADTAKRLAERGQTIRLVDADAFYELLKLAQRDRYASFEDFPVKEVFSALVMLEDRVLSKGYTDLPFAERF
jgi:restriction system protein